jgi:hypothetical protein
MLENIKSGEEYAELLINNIIELDGGIPLDLLEIWCNEIRDLAIQSYDDYLKGKKDDFALTVEEVEKSYKISTMILIENTIGDMVDKELLNVGVDEEGEIVYSLTDKGKEIKDNWPDE